MLSPTHPVGKNKFRWLRSTFGFEESDRLLFERLIKEQLPQAEEILERPPKPDDDDPSIVYRQWEIVIPNFRGPNGNVQPLLTAWALDPGEERPHFTSAYDAAWGDPTHHS